MNSMGMLILAEFKLRHNPRARRGMDGHILDYIKDLTSWGCKLPVRDTFKYWV